MKAPLLLIILTILLHLPRLACAITIVVGQPAAVAGPSYLLTENFEGSEYDNSWTEAGTGTIDGDYTGTVLQGSQSLRIAASAQSAYLTHTLGASHDIVEVYFLYRPTTLPGSTRTVITLQTSADVTVLQAMQRSTGSWTVRPTSGASGANSVTAMSTGTTYHVWCRYEKGTGANAVGTVGYSTDGTRPTSGNSFVSVTTGDATGQVNKIRIATSSSETWEFVLDRLLMDDATIGNSP